MPRRRNVAPTSTAGRPIAIARQDFSARRRKSRRVNDTIEVRLGEALETERLEPYLRERLPGAEGTFEVRQFGGGHANLTYLLRFGEREFVLRRPPYGPLPKGGHDMKREYRVLSKLYASFPLAPRAFLLCTDSTVLGADFVVMERRHGVVIRRSLPAFFDGNEPARRALSENFVDTLAALHSVDYAAAGLSDLGKPEGYLERQLSGWTERWDAAHTNDRADAAELIALLRADPPASGAPGLVHNDFKLDNAIVASDDPTQLVAVLDWDMCTIGDPLSDLGNVLGLWLEAGDPATFGSSTMPTDVPGFFTRAEVVARYAERTGRDCSRVAWYHAFSVFRYAVISQQIYARYVRGQTQDQRFKDFALYVGLLVKRGLELADKGI
ncbi:MAG: phosphotransferase family protein [Candidatus Eremiobacteraeota bacterium]|nr:phosphotransferase family protein [Candidatus Eremiobacteraeota bacterium]